MFLIVCGVVMSLGEENSGEVVEKSGLGDVGEEGLLYDPNESFSEHSSVSGNGKKSNCLMQKVANDGEDVEKLQFADRTDAESIVQLAQVVPPKMASVLEEGGVQRGEEI